MKAWGIPHTVSLAIRLGEVVFGARHTKADPVAAIIGHAGGRLLFTGKVADIERRTTGGFLRGAARLDGMEADRSSEMRVDFQNEFTVGWVDGEVRVTVPDIICVLDSITGEAIGTEALRYGQRVKVVALPAPALQTTPKGLEHVGPRAFGYDLNFRPLFPTGS